METSTVPANATALPDASSRIDIETRARQISFVNFDADDSGAMAHVITDDPHEAFLVAFRALIAAPWPFVRHDMKTVASA